MTAMANPAEVADRERRALLGAGRWRLHRCERQATPVTWQLPEEVPVALLINSVPYTVMMATPANLTDFGIGFALAEGIIPHRADILGVIAMPVENGHAVDVAIDEEALADARMPRRSLEGRSGCGLCGVENIADVVRVTEPVPHTVRPDSRSHPQGGRRAAQAADHEPLQSHGARRRLGDARRRHRRSCARTSAATTRSTS